jgi:hypothetical protein
MVLYKMTQKVFIKTFYFFGGSCIALDRQYYHQKSYHIISYQTLSTGLLKGFKPRVVCDKHEWVMALKRILAV